MRRPFKIPVLVTIPVCIYAAGFLLLFLWQIMNHISSLGAPIPVPMSSVITMVSPTSTPADTFIGKPAPDFALIGLDGKTHHLQDYAGKRVMLNFWATWCAPCRVEMPLLQKTYARLQAAGLVIIGVDQAEDADTVSTYVNALNLTFPIVLDKELSATQAYDILGLPTTVFIDAQGVIQAKNVGMLTEDTLQQYLQSFMPSDDSQSTPPR